MLGVGRVVELTQSSHNIPQTLRQLFNSSMSPPYRVAQPFCLALAPQNGSVEPVWYIAGKVLSGEDKICKGFPARYRPLVSSSQPPRNETNR